VTRYRAVPAPSARPGAEEPGASKETSRSGTWKSRRARATTVRGTARAERRGAAARAVRGRRAAASRAAGARVSAADTSVAAIAGGQTVGFRAVLKRSVARAMQFDGTRTRVGDRRLCAPRDSVSRARARGARRGSGGTRGRGTGVERGRGVVCAVEQWTSRRLPRLFKALFGEKTQKSFEKQKNLARDENLVCRPFQLAFKRTRFFSARMGQVASLHLYSPLSRFLFASGWNAFSDGSTRSRSVNARAS
jgi:hypothetical protein